MEEQNNVIQENEIIESENGSVPVSQETNEVSVIKKTETPLEMMQNIANSNFTDDVRELTNANFVKSQMKLFLIAECKKELHKVVMYNEMLSVIESRFQERFINNINDVPDNQLPQLMQLMMGCIDRSNNMINSILKDEEVLNLLVIQNNNFNKEEIVSSSELLTKLYNTIPDAVNSSDVRSKIIGEVVNIINGLGGESNA